MGSQAAGQCYMGQRYCLVHTQLFGARQQVLLIRQDVVEDEELGGDGVALSSSSTALPLLTINKREGGETTATGDDIISECVDGQRIKIMRMNCW